MSITRADIMIVVGAILAILLQVVLAPNIALFQSFPNIPLAYVMAVAVMNPDREGPVLPFVMGLVSDLLGSGPVGSMALLFVLASFISAKAILASGNDTFFVSCLVMAVAFLTVEVLYGGLLVGLGLNASLGAALLYRALPCAMYDLVVGIIVHPIVARLASVGTGIAQMHTPKLL